MRSPWRRGPSRCRRVRTCSLDSAFQDDHGIALGTPVTVTAETFGPEPTAGILIAATRTHYTLLRESPRTGAVHVHFPRIGYVLRKAEGA